MIAIVNYGMGNLGSIKNMLKRIGVRSEITSNPNDIKNANKLILPGVGSFDMGIKNLSKFGLIEILNEKVIQNQTPILGICLGMQLMTKSSEEGKLEGLNWINAEVVKFNFSDESHAGLKIPHMGWNTTKNHNEQNIYKELKENKFYFVHSYYVKCNQPEDILSTATHGVQFVAAFKKNNIFGVQFHPEKSHKFGMKLLTNFIELS